MSLRIQAVVDIFVQELKEALGADIQDRIMKEREMQCYIEEREHEVVKREAAWKAELTRRERTTLELDSFKEKIKENQEKIKLNKQLLYLVGNIVEVLMYLCHTSLRRKFEKIQ